MADPFRISFVCLGNICRSPTAAGVMRRLVDEAGLADRIHIDSAGTADYHIGKGADPRSQAELERRGVALDHRARQFVAGDFDRFDLVVAMDASNASNLGRIAQTEAAVAKIRLMREWDPEVSGESGAAADLDVPDPYYGGDDGFVEVFDIIERSCTAILAEIHPRL